MKLCEMIKVMQHYENGGEVEFKHKSDDDTKWRLSCPSWDWDNFDYRIKEPEQKVTIEKWIIKDIDRGEYFTTESSDVDLTLKNFPTWVKVKLIETYEVEL